MRHIFRFWKSSQKGATAIEYAILGGMIGLAILVSLVLVGDSLESVFSVTNSAIQSTADI